MTAQLITLTDDNMLFDEAVGLAKEAGMFLISNGKRAVISPVIPSGWTQIRPPINPLASKTRKPDQ
jgi:hypothetical protein